MSMLTMLIGMNTNGVGLVVVDGARVARFIDVFIQIQAASIIKSPDIRSLQGIGKISGRLGMVWQRLEKNENEKEQKKNPPKKTEWQENRSDL